MSSYRLMFLLFREAELDQRTLAILELLEEDADSFAKRAEMYYERRPQLISMIEEFYRSHRSLIERYDRIKTVTSSGTCQHLLANVSSPENKFALSMDMKYYAFSETSCDIDLELADSAVSEVDDPNQEDKVLNDNGIKDIDLEKTSCDIDLELEYSAESEVDDPEQVDEVLDDNGIKGGVLGTINNVEARKLGEEIERLREENRIQKEQLTQKDEDKKEVIRQLSFAVSLLMDDNARLRMGENGTKFANERNPFDSGRVKGTFLRKLFHWPRIFQ